MLFIYRMYNRKQAIRHTGIITKKTTEIMLSHDALPCGIDEFRRYITKRIAATATKRIIQNPFMPQNARTAGVPEVSLIPSCIKKRNNATIPTTTKKGVQSFCFILCYRVVSIHPVSLGIPL